MKIPLQQTFRVLPTATPLRGPSGAGGTPEAFGAGLGQSIQGLAGSALALGAFVKEQEDQKTKFKALTQFSQFETDSLKALEEAKQNSVPGDTSFYENAQKTYAEAETNFLATLPPDLQDEFKMRATDLGGRLSLSALTHQYEANTTFFEQGISDTVIASQVDVGQNPSRDNLQFQRQKIDEMIDSSGLGPAKKEANRRAAYKALESVAYREQQMQRLRDEAQGANSDVDLAHKVLVNEGLDEQTAATETMKAAGVAEQAFGGIYNWAAMPQRTRAAMIAVVAKDGQITNEMQAAVANGDQDALATELRKQGFDTEGDMIQNPAASLDDDPVFSNIPFEDRLALTNDAERQVSAELTDQARQKKANDAAFVNALTVAVHFGQAGQSEYENAVEKGLITDIDDMTKIEAELKKRDATLVNAQLLADMLAGHQVLSAGNEDHKKLLNAYVGQAGIDAINKQDSNWAANTLIPLIAKAQVIPSDSLDAITALTRSREPDKAYWALDLLAQIERSSPQAFGQVSSADQKNVDFYNGRKDYMDQQSLLDAMRGPLDPAEAQARAALRAQGEKLFTGDGELAQGNGFDTSKIFNDSILWGNPSIQTEQQRQILFQDYQRLFLDNYELHANVETAKIAAQKQLARIWGKTQVGMNDKLMKYPPEQAYPPVGGNYDWMEKQLRTLGIVQPDEEFQLLTDVQTANEWGKKPPSYGLMVMKNGVLELKTDDKGVPIRVNFEVGPEEQADNAAAVKKFEEQAARDREVGLLHSAVKHELATGGSLVENWN